jgi:succinyl-diaminopimelate desuccinylase
VKAKISETIDANKENMLKDIQTLIAFRSLLENPGETAKALDFVLARAGEMGMQTGRTSDGKAGFAQIGQGEKTVGILVHVDVVGIGDPVKWKYPPFELTQDEGYLYGRGIADDKGPVIMSLYAMKALLDLSVPLRKKVRLIVGTSEESEWSDMESYKKEFGEPDFGFSPDGEFPIYNIEKGYCDVQMIFSQQALSAYDEISAGDSPNTIPSKAILKKVGRSAIVFQGTSVHSSLPDQGDNAILKLGAAASEEGLLFRKIYRRHFYK